MRVKGFRVCRLGLQAALMNDCWANLQQCIQRLGWQCLLAQGDDQDPQPVW